MTGYFFSPMPASWMESPGLGTKEGVSSGAQLVYSTPAHRRGLEDPILFDDYTRRSVCAQHAAVGLGYPGAISHVGRSRSGKIEWEAPASGRARVLCKHHQSRRDGDYGIR